MLAEKLTKRERYPVSVGFVAPDQLIAESGGEIPVIVPAVDEGQTQFLAALRARLCLIPILAVVDDLSGHQTYRAIMAGATSVLNLELSDMKQESVLRALLESCPTTCPGIARIRPITDAARHPTRPEPLRLLPSGDDDRQQEEGPDLLVSLLCGTNTIAAIARRFYCSERSMYRRIRRLYDDFGVSSRSGLRTRMAQRPSAT